MGDAAREKEEWVCTCETWQRRHERDLEMARS